MRSVVVVSLALLGCGDESEPDPPLTESCVPPQRIVGDRCLAPGVQDDGCPAGTRGLDDGSCQPAGVPAELCAQGFAHDGDAGCEPILPADPCAPGQLAIPGERACHPVMACGEGTWGDIPVDGTSIYVDDSYAGNDSDGSAQKPWTRIGDALLAAPSGALIAIAAGTYDEDLVVTQSVRLWGVCPEQVAIAGSGAELGAIFLQPAASASDLRGIAVTSNTVGILISGAVDVVVSDVWVHDALGRGIDIEDPLGPTSVTLQNALVEQNHEFGVFVLGAEVTIEGVVARGTLPAMSAQTYGRGMNIRDNPDTRAPSSALVRRSLVEDNRDLGVFVSGSEVTLEGLVVRRTAPQPSDQRSGRGVTIQESLETNVPSSGIFRSSVVEDNHEIGVFVSGSEVTLEGLVVRRTLPQAFDMIRGRGINIQLSGDGAPSIATVRSSLVEDNHDLGVFVAGSEATIEGLIVRATSPRASDGQFGVGLALSSDQYGDARSVAVVRSSVVERSHHVGVVVNASDVTLEAILVRDSVASAGVFGDGVSVSSRSLDGTPLLASAIVSHVAIERSARAGLANFGAHVTLEACAISNSAFDLDGEAIYGLPYTFENLGGNGCGSPEPTGECIARSTGLAPPLPPGADR